MSTQKKTAYHHGNLKQTLVNAAFQALETTSWENLSLRALAKQAGVTPTAAYNHFEDKIALLVDIKTEAFKRFRAHLEAAVGLEENETAEDVIVSLGRAYFQFSQAQPAIYSLLFGWAPSYDRMTEEMTESAASCELIIDKALADYLESKDIAYTPYSQAIGTFFSWAMAHGVSTLITGGNIQAAAYCGNMPTAFSFENSDDVQKIMQDLFNVMVAGIQHGLPSVKE